MLNFLCPNYFDVYKQNLFTSKYEMLNRLFFVSGFFYYRTRFNNYNLNEKVIKNIYILSIPIAFFLGLLFIFYRKLFKRKREKKYELAIVAIVKNEQEYIREWVAFHKVQKVDKIYIYDNESNDKTRVLIQDFIDNGYIEYNYWPGEAQQIAVYNDALIKYGRDCRYMAFIDCDEYLMPEKEMCSLKETLKSLFEYSDNVGGVVVNWVMFGSSGYKEKPDGLCFETFTKRAVVPGGKNTDRVKSIIRPEAVRFITHPHFPIYKRGYFAINEDLHIVPAWFNKVNEYKKIRLNHYFTKTMPQWIERRKLPRCDNKSLPNRSLEEFYENDNNDVSDFTALNYKEKVKELLYDKGFYIK